ncbi:unnamed protein product [Dovyalis caffra]|uniref:Uncharacterized protein n=1 Tax=Dovyalis caffra TaxID=77055 RepID=A0AAV1S3Y1_9ROSI|nr:unnamed protein product [Dovyalis caffra]
MFLDTSWTIYGDRKMRRLARSSRNVLWISVPFLPRVHSFSSSSSFYWVMYYISDALFNSSCFFWGSDSER